MSTYLFIQIEIISLLTSVELSQLICVHKYIYTNIPFVTQSISFIDDFSHVPMQSFTFSAFSKTLYLKPYIKTPF